MSYCIGYAQRSTCLAPPRSPQLSKPSLCRRCQKERHVTAAYQSNNGPAAEYRPHSQATRATTAPEPQFSTDTVAGSVAGPQLKQWLRSPFDILALGPRATLGALLNAAELAQAMPAEMEKLQMLAQDPRPFQEKQAVLAQEVEATIASLVERGVMAESEIVASLQQVLPEQFQQLIPSELRNVAPQSPAVAQQQAQEAFYEEPPLSAEQLSICQSAEELAELQTAVSGVREALSDLRANVELSRAPVLKVNVRDARDSLRRRVNQISPETSARQGAPVNDAIREANNLLVEVDAVV
ncbi:TPA: hypothetical protein ACH3X3_013598 [Trebouxia sp. C0006]